MKGHCAYNRESKLLATVRKTGKDSGFTVPGAVPPAMAVFGPQHNNAEEQHLLRVHFGVCLNGGKDWITVRTHLP